jgi:hypothetical protein
VGRRVEGPRDGYRRVERPRGLRRLANKNRPGRRAALGALARCKGFVRHRCPACRIEVSQAFGEITVLMGTAIAIVSSAVYKSPQGRLAAGAIFVSQAAQAPGSAQHHLARRRKPLGRRTITTSPRQSTGQTFYR